MATATATPTSKEQGVTQEQHGASEYVRDERVNRFMSPARVQRLRAALDLEGIGTFIVSKRKNGDLILLDGAHRCTALLEEGFGDMKVPALVHHNLTSEREAQLFLMYNDRLAVDILERFRLMVEAGDPESIILDGEIRNAGFSASKASKNKLMAIRSLQSIFRGGSASGREQHRKTTRNTLKVIAESWGTERTATKQTIAGVGLFLLNHGEEIDLDRLIEQLAVTRGGANGIAVRADYHVREGGKKAPKAAELAVAERYNDNRRASEKIKVAA